MSAPKNIMMVPPVGDPDPLGNGMHSRDLIKGLRDLNTNLCIPDPSIWTSWYDGKDWGMTSVWDGNPQQEGVQKIVSFHVGLVPEWTQVAPEGGIIRRGWRSVLDKCIRAGVVSRGAVERKFRVNLDYTKPSPACSTCLADGLTESTDNASGLCDDHEIARDNALKAKQARKDAECLRSRSTAPPTNPSRVVVA